MGQLVERAHEDRKKKGENNRHLAVGEPFLEVLQTPVLGNIAHVVHPSEPPTLCTRKNTAKQNIAVKIRHSPVTPHTQALPPVGVFHVAMELFHRLSLPVDLKHAARRVLRTASLPT